MLACLGVGLDELDAAYWADIERIVRTTGPPARRWLKGLKVAPGIDPAVWDAFLADYFAAAARLVAPFDHVRLTTTFRNRATKDGRDDPDKYEEQRLTFVFDADDLFVVRSIHFGEPLQDVASDRRFEYDHPDGRPVLRSFVRTIPAGHRAIRVDVEECRFGPIPESEFGLEPFLTSLGPGRPVRQPEVEPPTATLLDWYRLAFVGGGISLAGGSGLALGSSYRDRRALRAD